MLLACDVGPRYRVPSAPVPKASRYKDAGWKVASPGDAIPRGTWWKMFREPELDALEARLAVGNQSIAAAIANYESARAQIRAARAQYFPTLTTAPAASIGRDAEARFHAYSVPLDASWAPDLFGRVRHTVRQRRYAAQQIAADLESTRLLAQATLAQIYFQLRGQDALQDLLNATVVADKEIVAFTRQRFEHGLENESVLVQAQLTLQNAQVQATNAAILRARYENAIATLIGTPATTFTMPKRAMLPAPPRIPTGAPSQLLERRPDIASAERQMAAANAGIGIARTAYFPVLTLTGHAGFASSAIEHLFSWPSRVWAVGATLSETLFDGGLRRANVDQATAAYHATIANYRQTVLTAFQQVEDLLAQLRILEEEIEQQRTAVALAQQGFELIRVRFEAGLDPYITLMIQQTALLSAQQLLVSLQVQQMTTAVQLVQALGGGWHRSELPGP